MGSCRVDERVAAKERRLRARLQHIAGDRRPATIEEAWRITDQLEELSRICSTRGQCPRSQLEEQLGRWLDRN